MKNNTLKEIIKENKIYILINILFIIISSMMVAYLSYGLSYLGKAIESRDMKVLKYNIIILLLISFSTIFIVMIQELIDSKVLEKIRVSLRKNISKKIINTSYSEFNKNDTGKYISWYTNDVLDITSKLITPFFSMFTQFTLMVSSLFAMFYINYLIGLSALALFLISFLIPNLYMKYLQKLSIKRTKETEKYTEDIKNLIFGFNVFYTSGYLDKYLNKTNKKSKIYERILLKINCINTLFNSVSLSINLFSQLILSSITVYVVIKYDVNFGAIIAVLALSGNFFNSTGSFIKNVTIFLSNKVILNKYDYDIKEEVKTYDKKLKEIEIKDLNFAYDKKLILNDLNLKFSYPNKYYIVGESGSGKSTLIKLLLGLYENNKSITYIDDDNNRYFDKLDDIAYISQDVYLFNASLKDNITLFTDYKEEEILSVIDKTRLKDFVDSLEDKLDTEIKENGKNLSGGQKQRIALARALIQNKRFIIIDEGTSQLDKENAKKIEEIILNDENICSIIITHHFIETENLNYKIIKL